eukprot:scaffold33461_cov54-Phaeocystis_antarctica.AAC.3
MKSFINFLITCNIGEVIDGRLHRDLACNPTHGIAPATLCIHLCIGDDGLHRDAARPARGPRAAAPALGQPRHRRAARHRAWLQPARPRPHAPGAAWQDGLARLALHSAALCGHGHLRRPRHRRCLRALLRAARRAAAAAAPVDHVLAVGGAELRGQRRRGRRWDDGATRLCHGVRGLRPQKGQAGRECVRAHDAGRHGDAPRHVRRLRDRLAAGEATLARAAHHRGLALRHDVLAAPRAARGGAQAPRPLHARQLVITPQAPRPLHACELEYTRGVRCWGVLLACALGDPVAGPSLGCSGTLTCSACAATTWCASCWDKVGGMSPKPV